LGDDRKSEGSGCSCEGGHEGNQHAQLIERVNASFKKDYDRFSERRLSSPTSESLQAKVLAAKATTNGHSTKIKV
jgi:hypothetical protein